MVSSGGCHSWIAYVVGGANHRCAHLVVAHRESARRIETPSLGCAWRAVARGTLGSEGVHRYAAYDRMRRHRTGVTTLWVSCDKRPRWARQFSTALVDTNDLVIDTVLQDRALSGVRPTMARPATIDLFAARWAEGRLTPVQDSEELQLEIYGDLSDTQCFQLDHCVDTYIEGVRAENERARERIQRATEERRQADALAKQARLPVENAMAASLVAFQEWFCAQTRWKCRFGRSADRDPVFATYERAWSEDHGVLILIGAFSPKYVFALAEPHQASSKLDVRVAAWTTGLDPLVDTTGFRVVYTPASVLNLADIPRDRLKPYRPKRRW